MSLSTDLEQLPKKKAELKNELWSLQKEENLDVSIKIMIEKWAIHELEEKIKAKLKVLEQLKSRKRELGKRLILNHTRKNKWF